MKCEERDKGWEWLFHKKKQGFSGQRIPSLFRWQVKRILTVASGERMFRVFSGKQCLKVKLRARVKSFAKT